MKNILIALFVVCGFAASAQTTTSRFSGGAGKDNTYRLATFTQTSATEAAGNDTLSYTPKGFRNIYRITMTDSCSFKVASVTNNYCGDEMEIIASGASGKILKLVGSNILSSGTATTSSNARVVIGFVFDGSKWVERFRTAQ